MSLGKRVSYILVSILVLSLTINCERDDICAEGTPTTPLLIIKFIDFENGTEIKAPADLQVKASDLETAYSLGTVRDSILIPLKTNTTVTDFEFTINTSAAPEETTNPKNTDVISIQYTPVEEYVSSACGFKVNYEGITISPAEVGDDGGWIKNITIQRQNITDESNAHVFIFH